MSDGNAGGSKLVDINCVPLPTGATAFVFSRGRLFSLVKVPSAQLLALVGSAEWDVHASVATPGCVWVGMPETTDVARFQAQVPAYIDTVNGNDDNDGFALATAIKSEFEFRRRRGLDDDTNGTTQPLVNWVGDNLTIGFPFNDDGPRYPASQLLDAAGINALTYVGTVDNLAATPPTQRYTAYANAVTEQFGPFILTNYGPSKVVPSVTCFRVMVGSDDAYQQPVPAHFAAALENLLTSLLALYPHACVSQALIPPNHDITGPGPGIFVTAANLLIPGVVAAMQAKGQAIVLEGDAGLVFPTDYTPDGVHLNASGDTKVAVVAALGIQAALAAGNFIVGGQLSGLFTAPNVVGLRETSGPTNLALGAVASGQLLKRVGSTVVGYTEPTAFPPNGAAGGQLSGTYPNPSVAGVTETAGPTALAAGAIADGQLFKRVGATFVGFTFPIRELYTGVTTVGGGGNATLGPFQLNAGETIVLSGYIQNNPGVVQEFAGESSTFGCAWYQKYVGPEAANQFHVFLLNNGGFARDFRMRVWALATP